MAVTHGHGNPKWTREEVILALDLYLESGATIPSSNDIRVKKLSTLLRSLPYHAVASRKASFRNPDGVAFKLQNLRQLATGLGLGNVSVVDRDVWTDFGGDPVRVKELAERIKTGILLINEMEGHEEENEFLEGRLLTQLHRNRERNPNIRKKLLSLRRANGGLCCEMCHTATLAFNPHFEDAMFEAHHKIPVSSLTEEGKTSLKDMILLCANCHRLLHKAIIKSKKWLDVEQAKILVGLAVKTM